MLPAKADPLRLVDCGLRLKPPVGLERNRPQIRLDGPYFAAFLGNRSAITVKNHQNLALPSQIFASIFQARQAASLQLLETLRAPIMHRFAWLLLLLVSMADARNAWQLQREKDGKALSALDAARWSKLPRTAIKATDHHGTSVDCEGVAMRDILTDMGAPLGTHLRGDELARVVVIEAMDEYRVVFALAEFDKELGDKPIVLVDRCAGAQLESKYAPLRLIVGDESRPTRWVRQVVKISLTSVPKAQ